MVLRMKLLSAIVALPLLVCGVALCAADFDSKTIGKYPKWSEKKAQWRAQSQSIKTVDFVGKTEKIVVSTGKSGAEFRDEREGFYNAHPTALKLEDGGILCVWNVGHGGNAGPVARSDDGGKTWTRIDKIMPDCYRVMRNCPSIYSVRDLNGKRFIQILSGKTRHLKGKFAPSEEFYKGYMPRVYSEDNGKTWRKLPPLSPSNPDELFACLMAFTSMVELKDGSTMAFFHKGDAKNADRELRVFTSITKDGGFTWSNPVKLVAPEDIGGLWACEPYAFRSPDGSEICCIMRENTRQNGNSLVSFSRDEGKTWSKPIDTPWALSGDRHHGVVLPDGRLFIAFRDKVPCDQKGLRLGAWIGSYDDIKNGRAGQYRILLSKSESFSETAIRCDGYYPSVLLLDDDTVAVLTYESVERGKGCSIVCHRFKISDIEAAAK